jgi:hypothetical protein
MRRAIAVVLVLLTAGPAWAQAPDPPAPASSASGDAARLTVAMSGIVVVGAGFSMMLFAYDGRGDDAPGLLIGGVAVVAAGVTMTWLGLRSRTVTIAPAIDRHHLGAIGVIRWGRPRRTRHSPASASPAATPQPSTAPAIGAPPPA